MVKVEIIQACKITCLCNFQNLYVHAFGKGSVSFAHFANFPVWYQCYFDKICSVFPFPFGKNVNQANRDTNRVSEQGA